MAITKRRIVSNEEYIAASKNEKYSKIINSVLRNYKSSIPQEDLETCGVDGLWRCLGYHIDGKGNKFTTSLWMFVTYECLRKLKKIQRDSRLHMVSLDNAEEQADTTGISNKLMDIIHVLPESDKTLIQEYYFDKYTMKEIGDRHNCSKETVRNQIKKVIARLRHLYK